MQTGHLHPLRRAISPTRPTFRWKAGGLGLLLCSGVAWASLPRPSEMSSDSQREWRALGVTPLSAGGSNGLAMAPTDAVAPVAFVAHREVVADAPAPIAEVAPPTASDGPLRIRGQIGEGIYWSLRAAGVSPEVAAQYLSALATQIDVGEVGPTDSFDLVFGANKQLLYAGIDRAGGSNLQLVRWTTNGRSEWIDAASADQAQPAPSESGLAMPANGPVTSYFGYRYHPILHFTRFHAGLDIGAAWGSPIVAAGDGQVIAAGWAGGYGREVKIAHAGGLMSLYGHMSEIVAAPGSYVRRGQLIGYVGSSGLSTGPHLHFEVRQGGTPVNPLGVHFASAPIVDTHLADAVKARLRALLSVGARS
jgi:murein DD-endopeptidase MepM/ murein hydrolase activator NlpD